jgi:hypothetical protein
VSSYTIATGTPYTDATLAECSRSRGRQNEPAVAVYPRNTNVILGSSNDYCGVYNTNDANGNPVPAGPIWLGYYRSENAGSSFMSSLVPGYPDDTSPYGQIAKQQVRTASSGDPVIAWDAQGRAFFGSESSDDPAGTPKTFGDVWVATYDNPGGPTGNPQNDGKRYRQTALVNRGSSAPNLRGSSTTRRRSKPTTTPTAAATTTPTSRGRASAATAAAWRSTSPARRTMASPSAAR